MKIVFNEVGCDWGIVAEVDVSQEGALSALRETVVTINDALAQTEKREYPFVTIEE